MSTIRKPCPFCGMTNVVDLIRPSNGWHYIKCQECSATGPVRENGTLALISWNARETKKDNVLSASFKKEPSSMNSVQTPVTHIKE